MKPTTYPVTAPVGPNRSLPRRSGGTTDVAPRDSVVSFTGSPPRLIPPDRAQPQTAPPYHPPHEDLRVEVMPDIFALARALQNKELEGEDFQNAARQLMMLRDRSLDPLVRRHAENLVLKHFKWKTNAQDWVMKAGRIEGPTRALDNHFEKMAERWQRGGWWTEELLYPHLDKLEEGARAVGSVPEKTIASMVHGSRVLRARADQKLSEETRQNEPPENDHRWSRRVTGLVEDWWQGGQFELQVLGSSVSAGEPVDFHTILTDPDSIVEVRGRTVLVNEPLGPRGAEKEAVGKFLHRFSSLGQTQKESEAAWPELDELLSNDPQRASHLLKRAVDMVLDAPVHQSHSVECFKNLLEACDEHPALKALLAPQAERLSTLGELTRARGTYLKKDNLAGEGLARFYHALLKQFPELASRELVETQLTPILFTNWGVNKEMPALQEWLCETRPDLSETVARQAIESREGFPPAEIFGVLSTASEHGWKPRPEDLQWLVDWMTAPRFKDDDTILSEYYFKLARLGADLESRNPGCWDGIRTFDADGRLQSVRPALLHMVVYDKKKDLAVLYPEDKAKSRGVGVDELYRWLAPEPDPVLSLNLMAFVSDEFQADQALEKQEPAVQRALVLLAALPRSAEVDAHLEELLEPYQATSPRSGVLDRILDEYRARVFEPRALEAVRQPGLSAEEKLSRGTDFLVINQKGVGNKISNRERLEGGIAAIAESLAEEDPERVARLCCEQVRAAITAAQKLDREDKLPARLRAQVVLAVHLAAENDTFLNQVRTELEGFSGKDSWSWDLLPSMKRKADTDRDELNWTMARDEVLAQPDLKLQTDRLLRYLVEDGQRRNKAFDQYGELVKAQGPVAETARMVEHLKVATNYREGQPTTQTQANELYLARELVDRDPARRELYYQMLEPVWLSPLGDDPVGEALEGLRSDRLHSLERQLWSRSGDDEEPMPEDERLEILEKAFRLADAAGEKRSDYSRDWRSYHKDAEHWSGRVCALYPEEAHANVAEACLAIHTGQPERDELLFQEIFQAFGTPARHDEIMRAFELARENVDSGMESSAAARQVSAKFNSVWEGLRQPQRAAREKAYAEAVQLGVVEGQPPQNQVDGLAHVLALIHSSTQREQEWFEDYQRVLGDARLLAGEKEGVREEVRRQALELQRGPEPDFDKMTLLEQSRYHLLSALSSEVSECAPFEKELEMALTGRNYPSLWTEIGGSTRVADIETGLAQLATGALPPRRQGEVLAGIFSRLDTFGGHQRKRLDERIYPGWWKQAAQAQPESALAIETLAPVYTVPDESGETDEAQKRAYLALLGATDTTEQLPQVASRMAALHTRLGEGYGVGALASIAAYYQGRDWEDEESQVLSLLERMSNYLDSNAADEAVTSLLSHEPSRERGFVPSAEQFCELLEQVRTLPMAWALHRFIEAQVAKGMGRQEAKAEGFKLFVQGAKPDAIANHIPREEVELVIQADEREVRVGGVVLPVRGA